jgi:hypothetical protein
LRAQRGNLFQPQRARGHGEGICQRGPANRLFPAEGAKDRRGNAGPKFQPATDYRLRPLIRRFRRLTQIQSSILSPRTLIRGPNPESTGPVPIRATVPDTGAILNKVMLSPELELGPYAHASSAEREKDVKQSDGPSKCWAIMPRTVNVLQLRNYIDSRPWAILSQH